MIVGRPRAEVDERTQAIRNTSRAEAGLREQLFNQQNGKCAVCFADLPYSDNPFLTVDHCLSVMQYACSNLSIEDAILFCNDESNLCLVHVECNSAKNAYDLEDFHKLIASGEIMLGEPRTHTQEEIDAERVRLSEVGRKGGRNQPREAKAKGGRKHNELYGNPATPEGRVKGGHIGGRIGGKIGGRKAVESGQLASVAAKGGHIQGRKNVEEGTDLFGMTAEQKSAAGRKAGRMGSHEAKATSGRLANHIRWHVKRGIKNPDCPLCSRVTT